MKYLSVCSGMEAASVAWEPLNWSPVAFSEIEPFPSAILKHRFPNIPNYGDLTKFQQWPIGLGSVDLLVGGTPCQSFSVAGLRKGLDDPRGNLALVFLGLVDRLQPKWVVWENVPGVLSSNGGRDFGSFLGALVKLGYGFAYRVLDAQFVGRCRLHKQGQGWDAVPQRRRRVFVVACRGPRGWESSASVLFKPESLRWHPSKGRKKGQVFASNAPNGVETNGGPIVIDRAAFNQGINAQYEPHIPTYPINTLSLGGRPNSVNDARMTMGVGNNGDPQFTLQAAHSHAVATPMSVRRLTPRETERLQWFPDDWSQIPWKGKPAEQCPDGPRYRACGNSMAVPVMRWIGEQIDRVEKESR